MTLQFLSRLRLSGGRLAPPASQFQFATREHKVETRGSRKLFCASSAVDKANAAEQTSEKGRIPAALDPVKTPAEFGCPSNMPHLVEGWVPDCKRKGVPDKLPLAGWDESVGVEESSRRTRPQHGIDSSL